MEDIEFVNIFSSTSSKGLIDELDHKLGLKDPSIDSWNKRL
jgi:hypothetical protein